MKNKITLKKILYFVLTLLPLLIVFILIPSLPEKIPVHYNSSGEINRFGSKYWCLIWPVVTIIFALIFQLLKFTKNKVANAKPYDALSFGLLFVFNLFNIIFLYYSFHPKNLGIDNLTSALLSIMFVILGNFMPKLKQNAIIGIRFSWTIDNETVWYKTHRLAGFVWVLGGIIMLPLCLFVSNSNSNIILLIGLAIIIIFPSVYSYVIYKKNQGNLNE
jgi:uncharacterized membrane protein